MKKPLWNFVDDMGTFHSDHAHSLRTLYFPLCNQTPLMASVTPDLHGDLKTGNSFFLLEPVTRNSLGTSMSSRNFWVRLKNGNVWSATGVSREARNLKDGSRLEAGLLWHKTIRKNKSVGLEAQILSFIPDAPVEVMQVTLTNITSKPVSFTPTAAIPLYARAADNLRDHRHVTSLLVRSRIRSHGVIVTPTLVFDEAGHHKNSTSYFVYGCGPKSAAPLAVFPTQEEFCGASGDLLMPEAVYAQKNPDKEFPGQGKEPMAGLRFAPLTLAPGKSCTFILLLGITQNTADADRIFARLNTPEKVAEALDKTKAYWGRVSSDISVSSSDPQFDNWLRWVSIQPLLRKIFGCSFLPDFDYGRGGRGWRDLWQDALSLILNNPDEVKPLLLNNFKGVRIDGSNATIIGQRPGEFIADRNNISRVWMDHGIWPFITTLLYLNQSGDESLLFERIPYFKDRQLARSRALDLEWEPQQDHWLTTSHGEVYEGTVLEHILIQHLVQFFNVGEHNHIRLEGADWNDGLDMARERGESVAFTCLYASNLHALSRLLKSLGVKSVTVAKEILLLLDTLHNPIDYGSADSKTALLNHYFEIAGKRISGETVELDPEALAKDLTKKAEWITAHVRAKEWLKEGFYNGYYDNRGCRVEGSSSGTRIRMTLTGQTFSVMSGVATDEQIPLIFAAAKKYLQDKKRGGFRLNTDFGGEQHDLGRAFSFVYGEKENGAVFSHMAVMFANGLYRRGFVKEGFEVIDSLRRMSVETAESRIYPCLPEYFNAEGRGMYSYLTGSASWLMLTYLTEIFGVRGERGDLRIEPKLVKKQFGSRNEISVRLTFAGKKITVRFLNKAGKEYGEYIIVAAAINGSPLAAGSKSITIPRNDLLKKATRSSNIIEIVLG